MKISEIVRIEGLFNIGKKFNWNYKLIMQYLNKFGKKSNKNTYWYREIKKYHHEYIRRFCKNGNL